MATPNANNEIKSIITGLLTSSTATCTVRQLCDDFFKFEGYRIPYRELGYNNVEEYFRSINDTLIVLGSGPNATVLGVLKPNSAHIVEMVSKQRKHAPKRNRKPIKFCPRNRPQSSRYTWYKPQPKLTYEPSSGLSSPHTKPTNSITPVGVVNWLKFNSNVNSQGESPKMNLTEPAKNPSPHISQPNLSNTHITQPARSPSPHISQPNLSNTHITQPARSPSPHISQPNLSNTHITQPARSPSSSKANLESSPSTSKPVRRSVKDLFETFSKEEEENGAVAAAPIDNNCSVSPEPELDDFHPHVPKEVRDNLKNLISKFPDGIWCSQLPTEYNKMFKRKLRFDRYSYRSLIEMCVDLPAIFYYSKPTPEDFLLCDRTKPFPKIDQIRIESALPEKEIVVTTNILHEIRTLTWDTIGEKIAPPDILRLGETIPSFPFGDKFQAGDYIDVTVGEIYDVSKFWINLEHGPLTQIMNDLQDFFGNNHNKYLIPEPLLQEDLFCCALYLGKYHRAVIVNRLPKLDGFVRVFFVDYGTVENVCSNEIWFLPKRFAECPCQAIRAQLSDICPPVEGLPWSRNAITRFNNLITNTVLIADIVQVDKEDNVLDIYLADVSNEKKIFYINDVLVKEGLAEYIDKERKVTHVDPSWIVDLKCLHMYPDFQEIEAGSAPSLSDINYIIANNLPMHHYLPQYFDISLDDDIDSIEKECDKMLEEDPEDVPEINLDEVDRNFCYSLFPNEIVDEIAEIVGLDESRASAQVQQTQTKVEKVPKPVVGKQQNELVKDKNSFKEYSCNKSRRAKLLDRHIEDDQENERSAISNTSTDVALGETAPLCASLNNLNLNNSTLPRLQNTNPFLNDESLSDVCTNPFLNNSTNPFLNRSRDEEIDTKELLAIFSKPSEDKLQGNIVNNLNTSPTPPRKLKQVNVERSENLRSSERTATERPIRAPPGFNVPLPNANMIPPMIPPMINYAANNPYYQRHPQFQWNNTLFLQNQFGMAMVQQNSASVAPHLMNMPQSNPQMQFNMPYMQQPFDQNFRQPGPRSFAPSNQKF